MEEKNQELLLMLQEAEEILGDIKLISEEKKLMDDKIKNINKTLKEVSATLKQINGRCDVEQQKIIKLIERIEDTKINIISQDIKGIANLIVKNLPNGIEKTEKESEKVYKLELSNNKSYIGEVLLYMDNGLVVDMRFVNPLDNKVIPINGSVLRIYSVVNYINMIIGYGSR